MATTVLEPPSSSISMTITTPKPFNVCFSFAAYAKNIVHYLKSSNIPVEQGLSNKEFLYIESNFNFTFPPDLRSILQEGLPTGPGFPNWRSSSNQQLEVLLSLPILGICKEVSRFNFWLDSWGKRPRDSDQAVILANGFLKKAPILVPIYRSFYIPAKPILAGNPVFFVQGSDIRIWCFDLAGFFQRVEFRRKEEALRRPTLLTLLNSPAWAATEPRWVEFWTAAAERRENGAREWWSEEMGEYLEEVFGRLRNGGWKEEDVREMMMMDGCDQKFQGDDDHRGRNCLGVDGNDVMWYVRVLSKRLLRAGWSSEDVVETLGILDDFVASAGDDDSLFDFNQLRNCDDQIMIKDGLMDGLSEKL